MRLPAAIKTPCLLLARTIDSINEWIGRAVAWLTSALVLLIGYDVVSRYCFDTTYVAVQELQWHLFSVIFLIGAAYTLRHDKHVRVDIVYARLGSRWQGVVNLAGSVLFVVPFSLVSGWASWQFAARSFAIREHSPNPGGLPATYVLKWAVVVCFALLLIQAVALICKSVTDIVEPPSGKSGEPVSEGL